MKHKTIALCITGYDAEFEYVQGIFKRCSELDINLLCFSPMTRKLELNSDGVLSEIVIKGETELYELINFNMTDGLILMGETFITRESIGLLEQRAQEHNVPVVNLNDTVKLLEHNVILSDKTAMRLPVRHLIEEHGRKRIGFIGGFPGNVQTEERLAAYKAELSEHGIPFDCELVTYGEFWKKAYDCTERLMSLENKPDAIVCANDSMAFFCMDKLKEMGYRVPEDVAVTGFDGVRDGEMYEPSLTSVKQDQYGSGIEAVNVLTRLWAGEDVPEISYVESRLVIRDSCGCIVRKNEPEVDFYTKHYAALNRFKEFNTYTTYSNALISGIDSSKELFDVMSKGADFFSFNRMFMCISPKFENTSFLANQSGSGFIGMSETMLSMVRYGHDVPEITEFDTRKILPIDFLNEDKPVFFAFSPLYFKNRFLGYVAFEPTKLEGEGDLFGVWLLNTSHNTGSFYMNKALEALYVKDHLTGLYNRHGMEQLAPELFRGAREKHTSFTVICADIDRLKPINDTYGHEAGDNAILQTANAIRTSLKGNGIAIRTGGDEFCIMLSGCTDTEIEGYIHDIGVYLDSYNAESNLPYSVGCSCGYVTVNADETDDMSEVMNMADEKMYLIKFQKKANARLDK